MRTLLVVFFGLGCDSAADIVPDASPTPESNDCPTDIWLDVSDNITIADPLNVATVTWTLEGHAMRVLEANDPNVGAHDGAAISETLSHLAGNLLMSEFEPTNTPVCPWFDPDSEDIICAMGEAVIQAGQGDILPFIVGAPLLVQHAALNGDGVQLHGIEAVFWDVVGLAFVNDLLTEVNAERMTPLSRCRTGCLQVYQCLANSEVIQSYYRVYDFYLDTSSKTHVRILSVRVDGAYDHTQED